MLNATPVAVPKLTAEASAKLRPTAPTGRPGAVGGAAPRTAAGIKPLADPGSTAASWAGSTTSAPATTSGKVFFVGSDGGNYVCSGSAVNSDGKNVVFTAGHCVVEGGKAKWYNAKPWIFVPRYNNGNAPYGRWTAKQLWSLNGWINDGNRTYDIGAAVMHTNSAGRHLVNVVGGQGIEWNYPLVQYQFQFGYPSRSPFNGSTLKYCTGTSYSDGGHQGLNCNMTEGASGGPWLDDFNGTFGRVNSVNSWVFWNGAGVRYKWNGPYFGNGARDLYATVKNL